MQRQEDIKKCTDIKTAIINGDVAYIKNCLEEESFDPDMELPVLGGECTVFYWACQKGQYQIVECLLNTGRVDVNKPIMHCAQTPLLIAAGMGRLKVVQRLLKQEAIDPNLCSGLFASPLNIACVENHLDVVKALLAHLKINVNIRKLPSNCTPLILASKNGFAEIVLELLEHPKIELDLQNADGSTALHVAVGRNHIDVATLLVAKGVNVDLQNNKGQTPLHLAVVGKHLSMTEMLLPVSDFHIKDKQGNTPLMLARKNNNQWISGLFEEYLLQKFFDAAEKMFKLYQSDQHYFQSLAPEIFQRILLFQLANVSKKFLGDVISSDHISRYILNLSAYYMTQKPFKILSPVFKAYQLEQNNVNFYSALRERDLLLMQNVKKNYECIHATQVITDKFKKISTEISNNIKEIMLFINKSDAESGVKIEEHLIKIENKLFMYPLLEAASLKRELQRLVQLPFYRPTLSLDTIKMIVALLARFNLLPATVRFRMETHSLFNLALIENKEMAMILIDYLELDNPDYLTRGILNRCTEIARLLIKSGSTLRFETSNALILALSCEQQDLIPDMLNVDKTLLDTLVEIENGNTLLHTAAQTGDLNLLKGLLEFDQVKELINIENAVKKTPLTLAIEAGHLDICKFLMRAGVEPIRQHLRLANEHNKEVINYLNHFFEARERVRLSIHAAPISVTQDVSQLNKPCEDQKPSPSL